MSAGPNPIGRPIRKPPARCSYCHGLRVTAIQDRERGRFGLRSVCADCYQREEGRPWVGPAAVAPVYVPTEREVGRPQSPRRKRDRRYKCGHLAKPLGDARYHLLRVAADGRRADWLAACVGRVARTQTARMVGLGWLEPDGRITDAGMDVYLYETDRRATQAVKVVLR